MVRISERELTMLAEALCTLDPGALEGDEEFARKARLILQRPYDTAVRVRLYPDAAYRAAALAFGVLEVKLIEEQNARLAYLAMKWHLQREDAIWTGEESADEVSDFFNRVIAGMVSELELRTWIRKRTQGASCHAARFRRATASVARRLAGRA